MVIYKNPNVSHESYFVGTGVVWSGAGLPASTGWVVEFVDGKWRVRRRTYYNDSLKRFSVVAENAVSLEKVIERAVVDAVIDCFVEQELYSMCRKEKEE